MTISKPSGIQTVISVETDGLAKIATLVVDLSLIPGSGEVGVDTVSHAWYSASDTDWAPWLEQEIAQGNIIPIPYVAPAPAASDVNTELVRRLIELVGATDKEHLDYLQMKGLQEAITLQQIMLDGGTLTATQTARKAELSQFQTDIAALRTAANVITDMATIPADYADNSRWPTVTISPTEKDAV